MTVNTPFTNRPALPWLVNFRPTPLSGMGDEASTANVIRGVTSDLTNVFRILHENEPGMYTVQMADGSFMTYRQPAGSNVSLPVGPLYSGAGYGGYGPGVSAGVTGSSTGILIAVAVVAALFLFGRGK